MRLSDLVSADQCFVTRVWSFSPESWGAMGFPNGGTTKKWVDRGQSIRVVCFVSHRPAEHIDESDQGRVLGVYELSPEKVHLERDNVLDPKHFDNPILYKEDFRFRWPIGLRATRAWRFLESPRTRETLPDARAMSHAVSTDIAQISPNDFSLLDQPQRLLKEVAVYGIPWDPERVADPIAIPASVYLFACGKSDVLCRLPGWRKGEILIKLGCSSDVSGRLLSFNDHPLAKIFGLKLGKVAERYVGERIAVQEEARLLNYASQVGRSAAEAKTEFFFISEKYYREIEAAVKGVLKVS